MKKKLGILFVGSLILSSLISINAYADPKVELWDLVDSGKHLDWSGSTSYQSNFDGAVNTWNAYKPGVIRQDTALTIEDVYIWDYYSISNEAAVTDKGTAEIRFNIYRMQNYTSDRRKNVALHELGHALGLAHNEYGDVMYDSVTDVVTLSQNDKDSYDLSYSFY